MKHLALWTAIFLTVSTLNANSAQRAKLSSPGDAPFSRSEDSFDDLIAPSRTKARVSQPIDDGTSIFDEVRLHGGVALVHSYQDFLAGPGIRERGGTRGVEINFGADIFSENWIAEGSVYTFPESQISDVRLATNGFELRVKYEFAIFDGVTLHGGSGLGNRYYTIKTPNRADGSLKAGETSFQSAASVWFAGVDYWPNADFSVGFELAHTPPMASGEDPISTQFAVRASGHF
jgi:hypothetical protein